jgi:hypothetical protein
VGTFCIGVAQLSRGVGSFVGPAPRVPTVHSTRTSLFDAGKRPKRRPSKSQSVDIIRVSPRRGLRLGIKFFLLPVADGGKRFRKEVRKNFSPKLLWPIRAPGRVSESVLVPARAREGCELLLAARMPVGVRTGHPRLTAHQSTKLHKGEPSCRYDGGDLGLGSG